jgi:hypothetical protein
MTSVFNNEQGREKACFRKSNKNRSSCNNGNENKNLFINNNNISNTMRIANVINNSNGLGKKTHFGNDYTNNSSLMSYLGTTEGQPGGIGAPLRNRF